ncbi:HEAT repeat-containing protein 3 [Trichonephila clavipes]|nr:HEAT repeat-containing protein 3 [Trichonephila clavipes]
MRIAVRYGCCTTDIDDGSSNFEPWSSGEDDTLNVEKSLAIRLLTFAERSFLTLADGAKYSLSSRDKSRLQISTLRSRVELHRFQLLSSRGKSRLLLAWHSRIRSASDQSALSHSVLEGISSSLQSYALNWQPDASFHYKDAWTPTKNTDNKLDSKVEIFIEACNILWNLCENSDSAVTIFNRKDMVSILIPCLKVETYGTRIPIAVAQCLYTVTENNAKLNEVLRESEAVPLIKNLMSLPATEPEYLLLKILAAGIKLNMFSGELNNCMGNVTTSVLEVVSMILQEPINPALELLCKRIVNKDEKFNMLNEEEENIENNLEAIDIASEKIDHLLTTKQISLEILGNIFDDNEEEDEWDDISSSDSEEVVLDVGEMEVDTVTNDFGSVLPSEILEFIMNGKLLEKVIKQIVIPPNEIKEVLLPHSKGKECLKRLDVVRNTALLCLNNVIQKLKVDDLEGPSKLNELWLNLGKLLFETDIADVEQVEAITRSLSAVARKLAEAKCSSYFSHMTESDLELLISICNKSHDSRIKVHMISILGIIGCLLGNINTPSSAHLIKIIGSVLLEISSKSVDMWVIAEALDALIDVFAEDYVDHIAQEINLVEKLNHILPSLKKGKVKEYRDHQVVITTTKTNLIRFIKYKNKLNRK